MTSRLSASPIKQRAELSNICFVWTIGPSTIWPSKIAICYPSYLTPGPGPESKKTKLDLWGGHKILFISTRVMSVKPPSIHDMSILNIKSWPKHCLHYFPATTFGLPGYFHGDLFRWPSDLFTWSGNPWHACAVYLSQTLTTWALCQLEKYEFDHSATEFLGYILSATGCKWIHRKWQQYKNGPPLPQSHMSNASLGLSTFTASSSHRSLLLCQPWQLCSRRGCHSSRTWLRKMPSLPSSSALSTLQF